MAAVMATRTTAVKALRVEEEELLLFFFAGVDTAAITDVLRGDTRHFSQILATSALLKLIVNSCV